MKLYFNNQNHLGNMWYVFSYGALYAYEKRLIDFNILELYLFQMSAMGILRKLNVTESLVQFVGEGIQIEDVDL
ncbi:MAG: hypothetical protein SPG03_04640 [Veillonella caviae]|nr:hypothetical protein [Veillonella caviae]